MPPGLPKNLAARLWLSRHSTAGAEATGHASARTMSFGSVESIVRNRVRMFLRHTWLVTILGTIVLAGTVTAGIYYGTKATELRIAAGPAGSANAKFVEVLSGLVAQSHDRFGRLEVRLVPTVGADASSQALADRLADLAIVPANVGKSPDWPVVAILRQNVMALIVPAPLAPAAAPAPAVPAPAATPVAPDKKPAKPAKSAKPEKPAKTAKTKAAKTKTAAKDTDADDDSDDDSAKDTKDKDKDANQLKVTQLAGKRIGIVTSNEATTDLLKVALNHYGVPLDKVQVAQIDPQNLADAVRNGAVDVIFVAGAATGKAISDAVTAATWNGVAPTFVEIDQADGIAKRNAAFDKAEIDAGTFGGNPPTPDDKLTTLSFAEYLVARKGFSRTSVTELAKIIYTSRLTVAAQMGGEVKVEAPSTDKDADALVHPGALDYLNDEQKTFFDRYGDDIFYGLLIFPIFGSAIAGLAGFLRADSRTRRLRHLQRVLDLVRKAHAAQTLEAIEQLQVEADHLVMAIIHLSEHEEFDESVRMSFSFALDQLRFAIAGRRTAILDHAAGSATASPAAEPTGTKAAAA